MMIKIFYARSVLGETLNPRFSEFREDIIEDDQYSFVGEFEVSDDLSLACSQIFDRFNIGDFGGKKGLRSMSGGDFIELPNGARILFRSFGFRVYPIGKSPYNCGGFMPVDSSLAR